MIGDSLQIFTLFYFLFIGKKGLLILLMYTQYNKAQ